MFNGGCLAFDVCSGRDRPLPRYLQFKLKQNSKIWWKDGERLCGSSARKQEDLGTKGAGPSKPCCQMPAVCKCSLPPRTGNDLRYDAADLEIHTKPHGYTLGLRGGAPQALLAGLLLGMIASHIMQNIMKDGNNSTNRKEYGERGASDAPSDESMRRNQKASSMRKEKGKKTAKDPLHRGAGRPLSAPDSESDQSMSSSMCWHCGCFAWKAAAAARLLCC
jgi:hypothetical protein